MSNKGAGAPSQAFGGRTKTIQVSGLNVIIRELSVGEVAQWMEAKISPDISNMLDAGMVAAAGFYVGDDLTLADLMAMTDLDIEAGSHLYESDLLEIASACKELNRSFLALAARTNMARAAVEALAEKSPANPTAPDGKNSSTVPAAV